MRDNHYPKPAIVTPHHHARRNVPVETALHPVIYVGLVGFLVWIMGAAWLFFGSEGYLALQLAVMSFLAFMFAFVPFWLARIARAAAAEPDKTPSFHVWAQHEFMTASGPVDAKHAAILVLLAPAAVAIGVTVSLVVAKLTALGLL